MTKPQKDAIWQQAFDDYCVNECGGAEPSGRAYDDACEAADEAVEEAERGAEDNG